MDDLVFKGMKIEWHFYKTKSCKMWCVQLDKFVSKIDFKRILTIVKENNGSYTPRNYNGSPAGFIFRDRNNAILSASQIYNYFHEDGIYPPQD